MYCKTTLVREGDNSGLSTALRGLNVDIIHNDAIFAHNAKKSLY